MLNMLLAQKHIQTEMNPLNNNYLEREIVQIEKHKNEFERKEDHLDISPNTLVGNSLSAYSDLYKIEKTTPAKISKTNSKLILLDNNSNYSKTTNINMLAYSNQLSSNLENYINNKPNDPKKKRVIFRDEIKITTRDSNFNLKNIRLPLSDVIEVESYKKYNNEVNHTNYKQKDKYSIKNILKNFTCQTIDSPSCAIF